MTILSVREKKRTGTQDNKGDYTYTREYIVKSDSGLTEKQAILASDGTNTIPLINQVHPSDSRAGCVSIQAKPEDDVNLVWTVTCGFKTWRGGGSYDPEDENDPTDPTTQRPVVSFGSAQYTRVVDKAYKDTDDLGSPTEPVENSAGDPFDPPLQMEYSRTIIEIRYNVRNFSPYYLREFQNTINRDAITVGGMQIPAGMGRMIYLNADPLRDDNDELYWAVECQIEMNEDTYFTEVLDQGFNYLDSGEKRPILITKKDSNGKETEIIANDPQKLDGSGAQLVIGTAPKFLEFCVYYQSDWSALNLPEEY